MNKRITILLCACGLFAVPGLFHLASAQSALPSGMIFYVSTNVCPSGSQPAQDAAGRVLVVTTDVSEVGKTYGEPMQDQQDNTHTHSGTMSVNLPSDDIAGASSCCNSQATTKGTHSASVTSGGSSTDLPFIQLLVCAVQ